MRFIIRERQKGKTSDLIITSEITGYPILVSNTRRRDIVLKQAEEMNRKILTPISIEHYLSNPSRYPRFEYLLIDDAESIIERALNCMLRAEVVAVTMSNRD